MGRPQCRRFSDPHSLHVGAHNPGISMMSCMQVLWGALCRGLKGAQTGHVSCVICQAISAWQACVRWQGMCAGALGGCAAAGGGGAQCWQALAVGRGQPQGWRTHSCAICLPGGALPAGMPVPLDDVVVLPFRQQRLGIMRRWQGLPDLTALSDTRHGLQPGMASCMLGSLG